MNIAIDALQTEQSDDRIEKSSQFDHMNFSAALEYDDEENEDEEEVNLNFSAMLYSKQDRRIESTAAKRVPAGQRARENIAKQSAEKD